MSTSVQERLDLFDVTLRTAFERFATFSDADQQTAFVQQVVLHLNNLVEEVADLSFQNGQNNVQEAMDF